MLNNNKVEVDISNFLGTKIHNELNFKSYIDKVDKVVQ